MRSDSTRTCSTLSDKATLNRGSMPSSGSVMDFRTLLHAVNRINMQKVHLPGWTRGALFQRLGHEADNQC